VGEITTFGGTGAELRRPGSGRRTTVVGLGATGRSVLRHFARHGVECAAVDTRLAPPGRDTLVQEFPAVPMQLGALGRGHLQEALELVVSPGLGLEEPGLAEAVAAGVPVLGDIELFARVVGAPVVAVTGSNGKSTVVTLLGEMARAAGSNAAIGGNLGTPALDLLPPPAWEMPAGTRGADPALYVLELSSFQLETTESLAAEVAVFLNVSADHLDRHGTLGRYVETKARVLRGARVAVVNRDDSMVMRALPASGTGTFERVVGFGAGPPEPDDYGLVRERAECWLARRSAGTLERLVPTGELPVLGRHNALNALAALAAGDAIGLPIEACLDALTDFRGLPHRCELVSEHGGVRWVNDSKATNIGAMACAVAGLGDLGPIVLIVGGDGKGADFSVIGRLLEGKVKALIALGRDGPLIARAAGRNIARHLVRNIDEAVTVAAALAGPGDTVLLSPACASWDQYASYVARGEHFRRVVGALEETGR